MGRTKAGPPEGGEQLEIAIPEAANRLSIVYVPRSRVHPDPTQPRTEPDADLRASIAREGILEPVLVRPHPEILGEFMLIDGERRWRGAEGIQEDGIPVIVRDDKDDAFARLAAQLIANSGKPLPPMDEARAYARLLEARPELTLADLAKLVGKPRSTIGDRLALLQLGPWVPLIDAGKVPISFATRYLLLFRTMPAEHQAHAIELIQKDPRCAEWDCNARDFSRVVEVTYQRLIYPLTKIKHAVRNPTFDTSAHDTECDCGRIEWSGDFDDSDEAGYAEKPRAWCVNPDWWKPRDRKGKAEARKSAPAAPSNRPGRPQGPRYELPADAGTRNNTNGYGSMPAGVAALSDSRGKWNAEPHRVMDDQYFDPSAIEIRPKNLLLVTSAYEASRVGTRDDAAVKVAQRAWRDRREDLLKRAREDVAAAFKKKGASFAVLGRGAKALLALLVSARNFEPEGGRIDLLDAASVAHVPLPPAAAAKSFGGESAARKWVAALSDRQAAQVLSVIAFVNGDAKVRWPFDVVEAALQKHAEGVAKRDVPWLQKGKAKGEGKATGNGTAAAESDQAVSDGDAEDDDA